MKASTIVTLALVGSGASYFGYRALRPADPNYYNSSTRPYGSSGSGYRSHGTTWFGGGGGGYRSSSGGSGGGSSSVGTGTSSGTSRGGFGSTGHSSSSNS